MQPLFLKYGNLSQEAVPADSLILGPGYDVGKPFDKRGVRQQFLCPDKFAGFFVQYRAGQFFGGNRYFFIRGYRDTVVDFLDMLLIDEDGNFHVYQGGPELATLNKTEIDGKKVINALQFGPALVIDGENVPEDYILDRSHSPWSAEPDNHTARMCIGQIDELSYIVFTCWDGMNLKQLRDLVLSITPVKTLYVLDGGNSAQMIFLKSQINRDDNANGNGRAIQDIIYFASAYFEDKE